MIWPLKATATRSFLQIEKRTWRELGVTLQRQVALRPNGVDDGNAIFRVLLAGGGSHDREDVSNVRIQQTFAQHPLTHHSGRAEENYSHV